MVVLRLEVELDRSRQMFVALLWAGQVFYLVEKEWQGM